MKRLYIGVVAAGLVLFVAGCNKEEFSGRKSYGPHPVTETSSPYAGQVVEYMPAPGQFINNSMLGFTGAETDLAAARAYAEDRLSKGADVSLGGFGGYITVRFDHSVQAWGAAFGGYDFSVTGNQFSGSSEPGVVWVKQDLNGNGLSDAEEPWYELHGSEYDNPATMQSYEVTYYRPDGNGQDIRWTDSEGGEGTVQYMGDVHTQPSYYPLWLSGSESYTLLGTRLPDNGYWVDLPSGGRQYVAGSYEWGYADNWGSDMINGQGRKTFFKISNAVDAAGVGVALQYIDFVKVQTGVNVQGGGGVGELSTEICRVTDENLSR